MCLFLKEDDKKALVPMKAEKDIEVFKVLYRDRRGLRSPYRHRIYTPGIPVVVSATAWDKVKRRAKRTKEVTVGLHSCTRARARFIASCGLDREIFKAIIPKGASYFVSAIRDEFASNKLIIIGQ